MKKSLVKSQFANKTKKAKNGLPQVKLTKTHLEEFPFLRLQNQLCFPLYTVSRLIIQSYRPYLEPLGITYPQYLVLLTLWERDGLSVKEIGKALSLDSGTLTPLLKKMEKELKLIIRMRSPQDDREVLNFLTVKAYDLRPKVVEMAYKIFCQAKLDMEDVTKTKALVEDIIAKLRENFG